MRAPARGFTLVEVLLALVVLIMGIYAMLRIFPRGYSAIEMTQQRTTAAQLAEAELNRWRLHPDALPDAIVATNLEGAVIPATLTNNRDNLREVLVYGEMAAHLPGTTSYEYLGLTVEQLANLDRLARPLIYNPYDLTPSQFNAAVEPYPPPPGDQTRRPATLHPCWQPNSLYLPRTIIGERVDIRRLGTTGPGVPFYLLSHAPLEKLRLEENTDTIDPTDVREVYVDIYDARLWVRVAWHDPLVLKERQFSYRPDTQQLYFGPSAPPGYERSFKVDYTDPTTFERVFGATVTVPAGTMVGTQTLTAGTDPATIQVHERMVALDDQQHEHCLQFPLDWPRNAYYVNPETWITGKIEFSPLLQINPLPGDIAIAKVDYRVRDWQILVFDIEVPPDGVVQLPIRGLKGPTSTNPPRQAKPEEVARAIKKFYNPDGSERPPPAPRSDYAYFVAVDRQTGEILTDHEEVVAGWPAIPKERLERFRVNYRDGLLFFNYGRWEVPPDTFDLYLEGNAMVGSEPIHSRSGRTYRIFCRGEGDWGVQLSLASRLYARSSTGLPGGPAVGGSTGGTLVTYGWQWDKDNPANSRQVYFPLSETGQVVAVDYYRADNGEYVSGEVHELAGPDIKGLGEWVCWLSGGGLQHLPNAWGPVMVRGLSVRARATWVTTGRASTLQDIALGVRQRRPAQASLGENWHQVAISTYLTRVPL